jgi:hypothetical protein
MDNVQNCDSYINIPSSQTYRKETVFVAIQQFPLIGRHIVRDTDNTLTQPNAFREK